jgi:hypothetical protein
MKALREKYPSWADVIEARKRKQRNFTVTAEESMMGDTILKVEQDGKCYYLNGKYAPTAVAERWIETHCPMAEYTPIAIIGISNGYHIRRIMEEMPKTANVLVYEPSLELFKRELEEVDLTFLFQPDIPVGIVVEGLNEKELDVYFNLMISYDNMTSLQYYKSGNYSQLFPEEVTAFVRGLKKKVDESAVQWNTLLRYTNVNAKNIFHNLHYLYEGYSVNELRGILPPDVPTIVVSAGPSLNKNIMDLKKAVGKACIIATDTAMKPLLNAGIIPNLFVIIDGLKPGVLFEHKDLSKVPMVTMTGVSREPMDYHKGKKFFYYSSSPFEQKLLMDLGAREGVLRTLPHIPTGGSVACHAYSVGVMMGSRTVILIGQDLAMTNNRTHADGTFQEKMDEINAKSGEYYEVESVDGGKVLTRDDFDRYRKWFENIAKEWDGVKMIDATEGGALIHGSKVMTLKNAIRKYCTKEYNVKWHIDHTQKLFRGDNRQMALDFFTNSEKKLIEVRKKAREGLRYYEQLEKLQKKPQYSDAKLQGILKKIKKINNYMEHDYMAETVMDSLIGLEYILRPSIYRTQEDRKSELLDVAGQGKIMLQAVSEGAKEIEALAGETIVAYAKEHPIEKQKK